MSAPRTGATPRPRRATAGFAGPGAGAAALLDAGTVPRPRRGGVPLLSRPAGAPPAAAAASAWLPGAPCTPRTCVESGWAVTDLPRAVLRLISLLVVVVAGIMLIPLVGRIPAAPRDRLVRRWCRTIVRAAGVRVRATGAAPPTGGLLLVANHISWLDIPLLAAVRPGRMLAKAEIRQWPVAGALTASSGALFIDRDRLRALPGTVERIADILREGAAVAVFPEGSTWCGRARGPFRRAVFQAALEAGVPVQPVRLHYRREEGTVTTAPAFVGDDSLLASVWRVVSVRGLVADVCVQPVLPPGGAPDRRSLALAAERSTAHRLSANSQVHDHF
ncbi:lysophospholipid acyltransferase family protein [Streptomyces sp. NPDC020802]|uniref:lysophospholipid acyltransferase family protein n=1 Tax=Streptomyces sp. NPDC020802 TaxID=3365094 RepID=UPI0037B0491C